MPVYGAKAVNFSDEPAGHQSGRVRLFAAGRTRAGGIWLAWRRHYHFRV